MAKKKQPAYRPLGSGILITVEKESEVTAGGIVKPSASVERAEEGHVISCGPDVKAIAPGDKVHIAKYGGVKLVLNNVEYYVVKESEVYGIFG